MSYEIEKNIPAPRAARGVMASLAVKMVENDSIVVPRSQGGTLKRHILLSGYNSTTASVDEKNIRVWKLNKKD